MKDLLFIFCQYLVPQHLLSRLLGYFAEHKTPWLKDLLVSQFIQHYKVDMSEALEPNHQRYESFNAFFTRELKPDARPITAAENIIVSPADGYISQTGKINAGQIIQAKGREYDLLALLGGDRATAKLFAEGQFATIYLSPRNYHRVHMPYAGILKKMLYVPGDLFSVNTATAENVPNLFARNERLVCLFETTIGPMVIVLVGAMIVAAIETVWAGQVTPLPKTIITTRYDRSYTDLNFNKGDEMGRFKLGSTAIVLFGADQVAWLDHFVPGHEIVMGEALAQVCTDKA